MCELRVVFLLCVLAGRLQGVCKAFARRLQGVCGAFAGRLRGVCVVAFRAASDLMSDQEIRTAVRTGAARIIPREIPYPGHDYTPMAWDELSEQKLHLTDVMVVACVKNNLSLRFRSVSNAAELRDQRKKCRYIGNIYALTRQAADAMRIGTGESSRTNRAEAKNTDGTEATSTRSVAEKTTIVPASRTPVAREFTARAHTVVKKVCSAGATNGALHLTVVAKTAHICEPHLSANLHQLRGCYGNRRKTCTEWDQTRHFLFVVVTWSLRNGAWGLRNGAWGLHNGAWGVHLSKLPKQPVQDTKKKHLLLKHTHTPIKARRTEIRTRDSRVKVLCADHYTMQRLL